MNTRSVLSGATCSFASLALLVTACANVDDPAPGNDDVLDTATSGAQPLYEASFSDDGKLTVSEDSEGMLTVSIDSAIGEDTALVEQAAAHATLEEAYLTLFPEAAKAPEVVQALSERIAEVQANVKEEIQDDVPVSTTGVEKSESQFMNTCCVSVRDGWNIYTPISCPWGYTSSQIADWICTHPGTIRNSNYRSWYYNNTGVDAHHYLDGHPNSYYSVLARRWGVHWWVGSATNATACLRQNSAGTASLGEMGITAHSWSPIIY